MTTLSGRLPAGELDGVGAHRAELAAHPERPRLIVAEVAVGKVTTNTDTGVVSPALRIVRAELLDGAAAMDAALMLRAAAEERLGRQPLPSLEAVPRRSEEKER